MLSPVGKKVRMSLANSGIASINELTEPNPNVIQIPDAVEELMEKYSSRRSINLHGSMVDSINPSLRNSNTNVNNQIGINTRIIRMSAPQTFGSGGFNLERSQRSSSNLQAVFTADNFIPGVNRILRNSESQVSRHTERKVYENPKQEIDEIAERYNQKHVKNHGLGLDR